MTSLDRFAAVREPWNRLAYDDGDLPFLTHEWLTAWWNAFGNGSPEICTAWRGEDLTGALPLSRRRRTLHGWSGATGSPAFRPLARSDADLIALVDAVAAADWSTLSLRALPVAHPATHLFYERLRASSRFTHDRAEYVPMIETDGTLEDYRAGMSQNTRVRVGKLRRRMEREHDLRIETVSEPADAHLEVAEALELEKAGWKGRAGTATLSEKAKTRFYTDLVAAFSERGELRLSRLWLDGQLASFDLAIEHAGRVYSLITSYSESASRFSPGLVLRMAIVEHCFAHGLASNDLLGSLLDWKRKFLTSTHETRVLVAYRRNSAAALSELLLRRRVLPHVLPARALWRASRRRRSRIPVSQRGRIRSRAAFNRGRIHRR